MAHGSLATSEGAVWFTSPLPSDVTLRRARSEHARRPVRVAALAALFAVAATAACFSVGGRREGVGQQEHRVELLKSDQSLGDDPLIAILRGQKQIGSDIDAISSAHVSDDNGASGGAGMGDGNVVRLHQREQLKHRAAMTKRTAESIVAHLAAEDGSSPHKGFLNGREVDSFLSVKHPPEQKVQRTEDVERIIAGLAKQDGFSKKEQEAMGASFASSSPGFHMSLAEISSAGGPMNEKLSRSDDEQGLTGFQPDAAQTQHAIHTLLDSLDYSDIGGGALLKAALRGEETALSRYKEGEISWGCRGVGEGGRGGLARIASELTVRLEELQAGGYARIDLTNATEKRTRAAAEAAAQDVLGRVRDLQGVCGSAGAREERGAREESVLSGKAQSTASKDGSIASENGGSAARNGGTGAAGKHTGVAVQGLREVGEGKGGKGSLQRLSEKVDGVEEAEKRLEDKDRSGIRAVASMIIPAGLKVPSAAGAAPL